MLWRSMTIAGVLFLALSGCGGGAPLEETSTGTTGAYRVGELGFDVEALPTAGDKEPGIDLYLSVLPPALVFERTSEGFRALYTLTVTLRNRYSHEFLRDFFWAETTSVADYGATQKSDPLTLTKRLLTPPGEYELQVTLEDVHSGLKAVRTQTATVVDLETGRPSIGRIVLQVRRRDGTFFPQIAFHIPLDVDSLRCAVDVYNIPPGARLPVTLHVLRYRADTAAALPPYAYPLVGTPMGFGLIDLDQVDTSFRVSSTVAVRGKRVTLVFPLPLLKEGFYRIEAQTWIARDGVRDPDTVLVASRFCSVKGPGFPKPVSYQELLDATVYIATDKEMREMRRAVTVEDQRRAFEAFWLNLVQDQTRAATLIRRYYSRVEEANRFFTTLRDGWRTDRGMVYCILGPPPQVSNYLNTQTWYYGYSGDQYSNSYTFKRLIKESDELSVEEYVLYRQAYYENFWTRMVSRWRGGEPP